ELLGKASASRTSLTVSTTFTGGPESIEVSRFSRGCATALTFRAALRFARFARRSADVLDVCARRRNNLFGKLRVLLREGRHATRREPKHVVTDEHLTVAPWRRTNTARSHSTTAP